MRACSLALVILCLAFAWSQAQETTPPPPTVVQETTPPPTAPNTWLPALITGIAGVIGIFVQEMLKRRNEDYLRRGLHEPIAIGAKEKRNSIILVGLGGTGKTTLIRSLLKDHSANPDERTEHYELYHGTSAAKGDEFTYRFFISDYKGQDIATLVSSFIVQQLQLYSPMSYGHIQSIILMVDLIPPKAKRDDPDPLPVASPDKERVETHLAQWSDLALDAIKGLVTDESLRYVCLFINKSDLIHDRTPVSDQANTELYADLRQRLVERFGQRVHVILGSTQKGEGLVELENKLRIFSSPR